MSNDLHSPNASSLHRGRAMRTATAAAVAAAAIVVVAPGSALADDPGVDCAEWNGAGFTATASRVDGDSVRLTMTYDDTPAAPLDVCPYTVFFSIWDGDGSATASGSATGDAVAAATDTDGAFEVDLWSDDCDWQIRIGVEESLPIVIDSTDLCLDHLRIELEPLTPIRPDVFRPWASRLIGAMR